MAGRSHEGPCVEIVVFFGSNKHEVGRENRQRVRIERNNKEIASQSGPWTLITKSVGELACPIWLNSLPHMPQLPR